MVKDHLIDDKIKRMLHAPEKNELTSETESDAESFEVYRENIMKKATASERVYKKKINKDHSDIKDAEYWKTRSDYTKTVTDYFSPENTNIDPLNFHRIDKTKRLVRALRLNNTFDFVREKNVDAITNEYNNYSKFKNNYSFYKENEKNEMLNEGYAGPYANIKNYISRLAPLGDFEKTRSYKVRMAEMRGFPAAAYMHDQAQKEKQNLRNQFKLEDNELVTNSKVKCGRLSPHAKESLYQLYTSGWTIDELSLKFGILPGRVKAVIFLRRYFYDEVVPNVDRTVWRLGLEREIVYATKYPFVDYGLDLSVMAAFEKGLEDIVFGNSQIDINPPPELVKKVQEKAGKLKPVRVYTIVRGTCGVGPKAYTLKDLVIRGGSGKQTVSDMFKKVCFRGEELPHTFPERARKFLDKGPRLASIGHRVSPRARGVIRFYNKGFHSL